ncbi:MAG: hypothetical protein M1822_007459 [Bathelium mastoideum]|nr:MAG: hypothetical protein M1822_007459 [Bathelium mastoideum]
MSSQVTITADMWEAHRSKICNLYVDQDMSLDLVMSDMSADGFQASKQQYTRQFKKWRVSKNRKGNEWKLVSKVLTRRDRQGKASVVFINNREIAPERLRKETRRYDLPSLLPKSPTPELMDHIRVCTPPFSLATVSFADTSRSALQLSQSSLHPTVQDGLCLKTIIVDDLPTTKFADLLDRTVETHKDARLGQSFSLSLDFLDDVKVVLKLCDTSLESVGFSPPKLRLAYEPSVPNNDPWKHLQQLSSGISRLSAEQTLPAAVQLLKLVISLSVNDYLQPVNDETFQYLIGILQEVDPLRNFVELIEKYKLYWIIGRVVNMHTVATDMFAGNLLLHTVELGLHKLTNLLLDSKCPLDATTHFRSEESSFRDCRFTALGLAAIFKRDLNLVRRLINAGASMDAPGSMDADKFQAIPEVMIEWYESSVTDSDMVLFQCLLDAKIATYQPAHIRHWDKWMRRSLVWAGASFHKLILESLLRLSRTEAHDICLALIASAMTDQASPFQSVLSHKQHWINDLRQDSISQLIFRSVLAITISKPSNEVLRLLINHGPSLSADFAADINWAILSVPKVEHDATLLVCQHWHDCFNKECKRRIRSQALYFEEFDVIRSLRKHGIDLHEHDSLDECLILTTFVQGQFIDDTGLLDLILEDPAPMDHSALICLSSSLARTGDLELLQLFVEQYESRYPSSIVLLEAPEFLISVFQSNKSEILHSLIHSGTRFEALNHRLIRELSFLRKPSSELGWVEFTHPPEVLQLALENGLLPCKGLLIMCMLPRSRHCVGNLNLVLEAAVARGAPISPQDLTDCLRTFVEIFPRWGERCEDPCDCFSLFRGTGKWRCCLKVPQLLVKFGAVVEIRWLRYFLDKCPCCYGEFMWEVLRYGQGPLHTAISWPNTFILEDLLEKGYFHDEQSQDDYSTTPLQFAAMWGNLKAIELLVQHGANINAPAGPRSGRTALQKAASAGHLDVVLALLRLGADINAPASENGGKTALESAAHTGRIDIAQLLIDNNTDLPKLRKDCKRASRIAKDCPSSALATMLENHARKLAAELGIDHEDEIDNLCMCEISRSPRDDCDKCYVSEKGYKTLETRLESFEHR